MSVALALNATIGTHISKITIALVRFHTRSTNATLLANWNTYHGRIYQLSAIPFGTLALVSMQKVNAPLRFHVAIVMTVSAFVLRWTFDVVPAESIVGINRGYVVLSSVNYIARRRGGIINGTIQRTFRTNPVPFGSIS